MSENLSVFLQKIQKKGRIAFAFDYCLPPHTFLGVGVPLKLLQSKLRQNNQKKKIEKSDLLSLEKFQSLPLLSKQGPAAAAGVKSWV